MKTRTERIEEHKNRLRVYEKTLKIYKEYSFGGLAIFKEKQVKDLKKTIAKLEGKNV